MKKIYSSIDIGSDTIKFVTGEYFNNKVNILASYMIKSKGVRKGLIVDANLTVNAIKDGIKQMNRMLGFDIKKVLVNIPSYNAYFTYVTGSINIDNTDDIITTGDVNKVIKNSVYNKLPVDYELVNLIPIEFILDNEVITNKPVGRVSKTLSLKAIMVSSPKKNVYSVIEVIEKSNLEVVDIVLSGLADYYEVRNKSISDKLGAIVNIGHETVNVSIVNNGVITNADVVKLGGINVEKDIAYVFGTNIFDARSIKEKFASSNKRFCSISEVYEVENTAHEMIKLNQLEVSEVVMNRMQEILNYAKKKIQELSKKNISYLIITGGVTEIKSFKQLVFEFLGKDVIIYTTSELGVRNNSYTTALGMIKYFIDKMNFKGKEVTMITKNDEELLISPNRLKGEKVFNKLFGSFMSKEERE